MSIKGKQRGRPHVHRGLLTHKEKITSALNNALYALMKADDDVYGNKEIDFDIQKVYELVDEALDTVYAYRAPGFDHKL